MKYLTQMSAEDTSQRYQLIFPVLPYITQIIFTKCLGYYLTLYYYLLYFYTQQQK